MHATSDRLPTLDGLRGVAVTLVLLIHAGALPVGWVGVDLFFALSGYLITGILLAGKPHAETPRDFYAPFYARRALRILPIALLMLTAFFVVLPRAVARPELATPGRTQLWYWLYFSNLRPGDSPGALVYLRHFWSLAVEEQFYLVWPAVVLLCTPRQLRRLCVAMLAGALLARGVLLALHLNAIFQTTHITFARWDGLAAGAFVASLGPDAFSPASARRRARWLALGCSVVLGLCVLLQHGAGDDGWAVGTVGLSALGIGAAALVAAVVAAPGGPVTRLLTLAPLRWLGTVSYGLYLYHHPISIWLGRRVASVPLRTAALFGLSVPVAGVSWYGLERPILALKRYVPMPNRRRPIAAEAPSLEGVA